MLDSLTNESGKQLLKEAFDNRPVEILRFKCNVFLSSDSIYSSSLRRYLTIDEKMRVKTFCEDRFGSFPSENYLLSDAQIKALKARGILKEK